MKIGPRTLLVGDFGEERDWMKEDESGEEKNFFHWSFFMLLDFKTILCLYSGN